MTQSTTSKTLIALLLAAAATTVAACGSSAEDPSSAGEGETSEGETSEGADTELASGTVPGAPGATGNVPAARGNTDGIAGPEGNGAQSTGGNTNAPIAPAPDNVVQQPLVQPPGEELSKERQVVAKLGLGGDFLIGLGNDSAGGANQTHTYALGQKLDLHYMYLSGLDWPEWNLPAGDYVTQHVNAAKSRDIVPMFTLYQAASYGENNLGAFNTNDFMTKYWRGVRIMFERLAEFDSAAVVHLEPDLWGYAQKHSDEPSGTPMQVGSLVPECRDLPSDVSGMSMCMIRLARQIAPKVVVGLSASSFGSFKNGVSDPVKIGQYMNKLGAAQADLMVIETLDRDAGCFENGSDKNCKRGGSFYWDESNVAHPNFHDHLAWAKTIRNVVGRPLLWWQMPLGVPSGGSGYASHYRDNRVRYLFSHAEEFAAAGGIGAVFGTGARNQTDATTDGGQFRNAVKGYYASPAALP
jgi:hypothetical protein